MGKQWRKVHLKSNLTLLHLLLGDDVFDGVACIWWKNYGLLLHLIGCDIELAVARHNHLTARLSRSTKVAILPEQIVVVDEVYRVAVLVAVLISARG